ncbi:lytic transglycosylase domain-containing protein [Oceanicella actignis]|uniref:Transglycosylase SLT domain-containing protein n=1 Tax=Oceanicella actignis TaxID=1189325 RepID=A0A1M7TKG8_9RHOB|nr:lytic transglycosylase domain-containing protein [Oceanicella actignis]SET67794.1 Transglycosylase SLT domain-containing protein [Oceanicella actignis]SHN71113.1 Transglycosylase SLT domain-containing protein [Oceanicella actignis]
MIAAAHLFAAIAGAACLPAKAAGLPVVRSAPLESDFSFRRVRPPAPGARRRIIFETPPAAAPAAVDEFWRRIDPRLSAASPDRLAAAARSARESVRAPQPEALEHVARRHGLALTRAEARRRVSRALLMAMIAVESGGRENARSPAGALGLMQLMPATARRVGVRDPLDPAQNIAGGAAYLDMLLRMFDEDAVLALAAYNAGENAVISHGGVPPWPETRAYVPKVLAAFAALGERLCSAPPRGPRDPCPPAP